MKEENEIGGTARELDTKLTTFERMKVNRGTYKEDLFCRTILLRSNRANGYLPLVKLNDIMEVEMNEDHFHNSTIGSFF